MRRKTASHFVLAKQGPQTDELTPAPQIFPLLKRSSSRVVCIWCLETRTERDAVPDCLELRIRKMGLRIGASLVRPPQSEVLLDVVRLVCGNRSRAGCGVGLPRIAYSRNWALDSAISRRRFEDSPIIMTRSPWRVMCDWRVGTQAERDAAADCLELRIREIGPSTRRFPCQSAKYSLFWSAHRRKRRILGG